MQISCTRCHTPRQTWKAGDKCEQCGSENFVFVDDIHPVFAIGERRPIAMQSSVGITELLKETPEVYKCPTCGWTGIHPVQDPEDQPDDAVPFDLCPRCHNFLAVIKGSEWVDVDAYPNALEKLQKEFSPLDMKKHKWRKE